MTWRSAAAALLVSCAAAAPASAATRVATVDDLAAGPVLAGTKVAWGVTGRVRDDQVRELEVRARVPGRPVHVLYRSALPRFSRYSGVLLAELDASQQALGVVLDLNESCCGSVYRVRGGLLQRPFRRLSTTEGPSGLDVDGPRIAFVENAAYENDPASEGESGPPETPCDAPGLPACSTINIHDVNARTVVALPAPSGHTLDGVRLAGRYVAWVERERDTALQVTVWDLHARAEAYSVPAAAWGGEPERIDVTDGGTLVVATTAGRLGYATRAEPFAHGLPGRTDRGTLRTSAERIAFRSPRGALKTVTLDGALRTLRGSGVRKNAWDFAAGQVVWSTRRAGRDTIYAAPTT